MVFFYRVHNSHWIHPLNAKHSTLLRKVQLLLEMTFIEIESYYRTVTEVVFIKTLAMIIVTVIKCRYTCLGGLNKSF